MFSHFFDNGNIFFTLRAALLVWKHRYGVNLDRNPG
jgi:hypothetical protein